MGLEDDRREDLHPVGDELAVSGLAQLAGLAVKAEAPGPIAGDAGGAACSCAGAHRLQRLGDPSGDELVVARRLRALAALERRSQCSQELCQDSSRGSSSVKTCGLPPRRGEHL